MTQQTLATIGALALPLVFLATRVDWAWLRSLAPSLTPTPLPPVPQVIPTEADYLTDDYKSLMRLKDRAARFDNAEMWEALETVEQQFMVYGEGWE